MKKISMGRWVRGYFLNDNPEIRFPVALPTLAGRHSSVLMAGYISTLYQTTGPDWYCEKYNGDEAS